MSSEVLYQCQDCGQVYTTVVRADRLDSCRVEDCTGTPKRVWTAVNFSKVPGGNRV